MVIGCMSNAQSLSNYFYSLHVSKVYTFINTSRKVTCTPCSHIICHFNVKYYYSSNQDSNLAIICSYSRCLSMIMSLGGSNWLCSPAMLRVLYTLFPCMYVCFKILRLMSSPTDGFMPHSADGLAFGVAPYQPLQPPQLPLPAVQTLPL